LVPIAFLVAVDACDENVGANVEFAFLVEEGHDVLLDYVSSRSAHLIDLVSFDDLLYFFDVLDNFNTCTSICIFTGFNKPRISFLRFEAIFKLLIFLFFLFLLYIISSPFIFFLEFLELLILAVSDMEGHRDVLKRISLLSFIVIFQIHKQGLLVGEIPVVSDVIVHFDVS